ncbi:MAG: arylsulfatase [Bryobacter sp.]|nr:arylsulfatase [Bryobacter sp.]
MLNRRAAISALTGANFLLGQGPRPRRPNILVVMTDDQGYGDLSLHGNANLQTPNLDALAKQGAQCTRFHVSPVCSPTRSSLLTGRYNYRTGVVDTFLGRSMMRPTETTIAEMLRPAGYRTGIFGKWHLGDNYPLRPVDQGFDESLVLNGGGIRQPGDPPEALTGKKPSYFDPVLSRNGKWEQTKGYCTDVYFREAMRFMVRRAGRPFFCYLATNAPHTPLEVDEEKVKPFLARGLDETTARVYAMVENIDENMGRMLAFLREQNLEQNTLLVFLSDNGPQQQRFNAGMRGRKGSVYEGGTRVPCFVRWPGVIAPEQSMDRLAAHIDVVPTLLEAAQVKTNVKLDGKSLLPLFREPSKASEWADRKIFLQWHRGDQPEAFRASAVVTQKYKLVDGKELFDLEADPAESRDVAAAHPEVVKDLRQAYELWFTDVGQQGYAPPRIVISKLAPTLLTRQDWRGTQASWDTKGIGHWEVQTAFAGPYTVTLLFSPSEAKRTLEGTWIGKHEIAPGQTKLELKQVKLPILREAKFEASLREGDAARGIDYAYFVP